MNINDILHSFVDIIKSYLGENYALKSELSKVPIGTISWVMGENVPTGYLICNGQNVSRESYPKLFEILGTRYGEGDGETTFGLPNLIGKFLQGDTTSGTTGGEATHTLTIDEIPSHRHTSVQRHAGTDDQNFSGHIANAVASNDTSSPQEQLYTDYTGGSMAHNNLPPYITSIPCIKAFDTVTNTENLDVSDLLESKLDKSMVAKPTDTEVFGKVPYCGTDGSIYLGSYRIYVG